MAEKEKVDPAFHFSLLLMTILQQLDNLTLLDAHGSPQPKGGYLAVLRISDGALMLLCAFGDIPPNKIKRYRSLSLEKAQRLRKHPEHITSFQSRDHAKKQYGGAIRADKSGFIFSFSGLPSEELDEALATVSSKLSWFLGLERAIEIVETTHNPHIPRFED